MRRCPLVCGENLRGLQCWGLLFCPTVIPMIEGGSVCGVGQVRYKIFCIIADECKIFQIASYRVQNLLHSDRKVGHPKYSALCAVQCNIFCICRAPRSCLTAVLRDPLKAADLLFPFAILCPTVTYPSSLLRIYRQSNNHNPDRECSVIVLSSMGKRAVDARKGVNSWQVM